VNRHTFHGVGAHNHGSAADDVDEIPNNVITEAINNAIAHRNYASNGSIQVEVYQDRIEVISPGRLMSPLTIDMLYGKHESVAPNPHIARAMFWVKYIETVGTGLNDLLDSCATAGLKRPTLEANDLHFRVIIWRSADKTQINENKSEDKTTKDDEIVAFIVNNASLSVKDIANKLQIKLGVMRSTIARLKREKGLVHVGSRKTGHWAFSPKTESVRSEE